MNNYIDSRGRLHDKPVTEANPFPSNNPAIYSAYSHKVGVKLNLDDETMLICATDRVRHRAEDKISPPQSRDEILGLEYLGYNDVRLSEDGWKFNPKDRPIPKFSLIKLFKQARALVVVQPYYKRILGVDVKMYHFELAHRNFFWQNNLDQIYRFAFSVPLQDRYSILKWSGKFKFYRPDHLLYLSISLIDRLGKPSGIHYLKYGGEKNLIEMVKEFSEDHPIRQLTGL
jgi:hypothetical protein